MDDRVLLEVDRVAQESHKDVLGSDMYVKASTDHETSQANAICNLLDSLACATERRRGHPLTAIAIDDQGEGQVGGRHDSHAEVDGFVVVPGFLHLGDDGKECRRSSARAEDGSDGGDARDECWVADDMVSEFEVACLWGGGRSVYLRNCNTAVWIIVNDILGDDESKGTQGYLHDNENCNVYRQKAGPCQPRNFLELASTGKDKYCHSCHQHEVIGADGVVREGIESNRGAKNPRCANNSIGDEKQNANNLLQPNTTNNIGHVCDGVAASMRVAEIALDDGAICVQELPAQHIDSTGQSTQDKHC